MTKLTTKFLFAAAVATLVVAITSAPSEARRKKMAAPASCGAMGALCSTDCANGFCNVKVCGGDGLWYAAILTPICPQSTCFNVRKKC